MSAIGSSNGEIDRIFYRGYTLMLTRTATFSDGHAATIQSAIDLYSTGSAAARAITQAWAVVGVN
jgi:Zn-dependent metalloprotease